MKLFDKIRLALACSGVEALGGKSIKDIRAEFIQVRAEVNAPNTEGPMKRKMCSNHWSSSYTGYGDLPTSVMKEMVQYMV